MPDSRPATAALTELVEIWHDACTSFAALARSLTPEEGRQPTDLAGWDVHANVAHLAHLEAVLAGAPEETIAVEPAPHLLTPVHYYTEQGVLARREVGLPALVDEFEMAVEARYAALLADPPTDPDAAPPKTPGDAGWSTGILLTNRPLDVWMHEQDVRRATDRPGGLDSVAARHAVDVLGRGLPMVVGKRVAPPVGTTVRVVVLEHERSWTVTVGDDGRARPGEATTPATTTVTLGVEDFVTLAGGRRRPADAHPQVEGDADLAARLLASMAVTP